jgi:hypothetical protein
MRLVVWILVRAWMPASMLVTPQQMVLPLVQTAQVMKRADEEHSSWRPR